MFARIIAFISDTEGSLRAYCPLAGIHSVTFDEQCQHIVAMCSLEGEVVPLRNLVRISSFVEVKLRSLVLDI